MWCWFYLVYWIYEKCSMIVHTAAAFKSLELKRKNICTASPLPSFIHFQWIVMLFLASMDQTNWLMTLILPAFNLPLSTVVKAVPRKCQANFFFFFSNHQNVLLERDSVEWRWERRSILCLVSWNAFEVSVTLKTHQHMAQGKVRASFRVGTSSMFWRISHSGP